MQHELHHLPALGAGMIARNLMKSAILILLAQLMSPLQRNSLSTACMHAYVKVM